LLDRYARDVDAYRGDESFAYSMASALLDLALGFATHDRSAARQRVKAGLVLTAKHGFHELDFQLRALAEQLAGGKRDSTHTGRIHVAPRGETVLRDLIHEAEVPDLDRRTRGRRAMLTTR
jgi:hypothetical protein